MERLEVDLSRKIVLTELFAGVVLQLRLLHGLCFCSLPHLCVGMTVASAKKIHCLVGCDTEAFRRSRMGLIVGRLDLPICSDHELVDVAIERIDERFNAATDHRAYARVFEESD